MPVVLVEAILSEGLISQALQVAEASAPSLRTCLAEKVNRVGALVASKASLEAVQVSDIRHEPIPER